MRQNNTFIDIARKEKGTMFIKVYIKIENKASNSYFDSRLYSSRNHILKAIKNANLPKDIPKKQDGSEEDEFEEPKIGEVPLSFNR